jgi:hypothetical protein
MNKNLEGSWICDSGKYVFKFENGNASWGNAGTLATNGVYRVNGNTLSLYPGGDTSGFSIDSEFTLSGDSLTIKGSNTINLRRK